MACETKEENEMDYETEKYLQLEEEARQAYRIGLAEFREKLTLDEKEELVLDLLNAPSDYDQDPGIPEHERCAKWHWDLHLCYINRSAIRMCEHYEMAIDKHIVEVYESTIG